MAEAAAAAAIPPVPDYQPPLPPSTSPSGQRLVEQQIAEKDNAPEWTLRTTVTAPNSGPSHGPNAPGAERRETTVLPVLEEAAEGTPTGDRSRNSRVSSLLTESDRPLTPAKDGHDREPGFGNPLLGGRTRSGSRGSSGKARPPPTPPKTGHGYPGQGKAESADSGYGVLTSGSSNGGLKSLTGSQKSLNLQPRISRDSLDKALPPLPNAGPSRSQGVS
jgi:1-phosphatidylinositol-4-phosphate 5-kinase